MDFKITKTKDILLQLEKSIKEKTPFGLLRLGDGGLKVMNAVSNNNKKQLIQISEQEGIPIHLFNKLIKFWKTSGNICDYIDTPEVYFTENFWIRGKSKNKKMSDKTISLLKNWKVLYDNIGITNTNYCNPEVNFLSCIVGPGRRLSLPDIIKDRKVCCITSRDDVSEKLSDYNIDVLKICGKFENQFKNSFLQIVNEIDNKANNYDLWLIAAGELGRIYPGLIKFKGGRAFDIGSLIDFWCDQNIPDRLTPYLTTTTHHSLKLIFTENGKEFSKFI